MAQKVPSGRDKRRVVAKLNPIQDIEHNFCRKLVDGESIEGLELQPSLETILN